MQWGGKVVWITGASSGIGAALARELDRRGAVTAGTARREDRLKELERELAAFHPLPGDVTDREQMHGVVARIERDLGGLDVAVLNAGISARATVERFDAEAVRQVVDVNLMGTVHGLEAALPALRRRGRGAVVGVASVAGYRGLPGAAAYCATKAAQNVLLESLRIEAPDGLSVVTVNPGFVATELTAEHRGWLPFLISAQQAAVRIADGVERGRQEIVFPLPTALGAKVMRLLPVRVHAALMRSLAPGP